MSSDRDAALRLGMGPIADVATALANLPPEEKVLTDALLVAGEALERVLACENSEVSLCVLLVSCLNRDLDGSGYLWCVDKDGEPEKHYFASGATRDAIKALIGV